MANQQPQPAGQRTVQMQRQEDPRMAPLVKALADGKGYIAKNVHPKYKDQLTADVLIQQALSVITDDFRRGDKASLTRITQASLVNAVATAAQMGLPIGGIQGLGYLMRDFRDPTVARFIPSPKGWLALANRAESISVMASSVREKDTFDYLEGTEYYLKHKRALSDRGDITAAYLVVRFLNRPNIPPSFLIMDKADLDKRKAMSKSGTTWSQWPDEMAAAKVIARAIKTGLLPIDPYAEQAIMEAASFEGEAPGESAEGGAPAGPAPLVIPIGQPAAENRGHGQENLEALLGPAGGQAPESGEPEEDPFA